MGDVNHLQRAVIRMNARWYFPLLSETFTPNSCIFSCQLSLTLLLVFISNQLIKTEKRSDRLTLEKYGLTFRQRHSVLYRITRVSLPFTIHTHTHGGHNCPDYTWTAVKMKGCMELWRAAVQPLGARCKPPHETPCKAPPPTHPDPVIHHQSLTLILHVTNVRHDYCVCQCRRAADGHGSSLLN